MLFYEIEIEWHHHSAKYSHGGLIVDNIVKRTIIHACCESDIFVGITPYQANKFSQEYGD
jgi:hypothetical protein